jgi:hypothetical protein
MSVGDPRAGWMRREIPGDDRRAFEVVQRRGAGRKGIESLGPWPRRRWGVKSRLGHECYTAWMTHWIDL